jgi:hypothetical protein
MRQAAEAAKPAKRLALTDVPGSTWKIERRAAAMRNGPVGSRRNGFRRRDGERGGHAAALRHPTEAAFVNRIF